MTRSEAPYHFLHDLQQELEFTSSIPLWGAPPAFPWGPLLEKLKSLLPLTDLFLYQIEWRSASGFSSGMGTSPIHVSFELPPLKDVGHLLIAREDLAKIAGYALSPSGNFFSDPSFQEGFYRYLLLEVAALINQLQAFSDLRVVVKDFDSLPTDGAFCLDIQIGLKGEIFWARVICPSSLQESFKKHFAKHASLVSSPLAQRTEMPVILEAGSVRLPLSKWKEVRLGDLLLLDRCTIDPLHHKGTLTISTGGSPLFQARFKGDEIKILDYILHHEEEDAMYEEEFDKEEEFDEDLFETEDVEEAGEEERRAHHEERPLWSEIEERSPEEMEKLINTEEIPLTLKVEVGRLKMSIAKLLDLQPGNVLEMKTRIDQGVYLTIDGKRVAKGELVKLGEVLGVKILQIGSHE